MDFRSIKTGDQFLDYLDSELNKKKSIKLEGGTCDYAILVYDKIFNVYILNDFEYSVPYLCGYKMFGSLLEALVNHSTHHSHYHYNKTPLNLTWSELS